MFKFDETILSESEIKTLLEIILEKESLVKSLGPDIYGATSDNSLSGRHLIFNWLSVKEVGEILIPKLKDIFLKLGWKLPVTVQCWSNTFRENEGIDIHKHRFGFFPDPPFYCSNLFLSGNTKPGTAYFGNGITYLNVDPVFIENVPGKIMIFDSETWHGVPPNTSDEIRVSMAMDYYPGIKEDLEYPNRFYIIS